MFFVVACVACGTTAPSRADGAAGDRLCRRCRADLVPPGPGAAEVALVAYDGVGRQPIVALKYRSGRSLVPMLADALAARAVAEGWLVGLEAVTWAPTGVSRRRRRGYDQAELLARAVGRRLGVRARRLLVRVGDEAAQTGRGRRERLVGPTFVAIGRVPARVLVIDDVVTTGATFAAARTALLVAGAHRVHCLAAAATPQARRDPDLRPVPRVPKVSYPPVTGGQLVAGGVGRHPRLRWDAGRHDN